MMMKSIERKQVTEPCNFIWIPTGYAFGVPTGMTGWWDGDRNPKTNAPIVTFPEGDLSLASEHTPMYEPTKLEIDTAIQERGLAAYPKESAQRTENPDSIAY